MAIVAAAPPVQWKPHGDPPVTGPALPDRTAVHPSLPAVCPSLDSTLPPDQPRDGLAGRRRAAGGAGLRGRWTRRRAGPPRKPVVPHAVSVGGASDPVRAGARRRHPPRRPARARPPRRPDIRLLRDADRAANVLDHLRGGGAHQRPAARRPGTIDPAHHRGTPDHCLHGARPTTCWPRGEVGGSRCGSTWASKPRRSRSGASGWSRLRRQVPGNTTGSEMCPLSDPVSPDARAGPSSRTTGAHTSSLRGAYAHRTAPVNT